MNYKKNFKTIIKNYIDIAKDLCYNESIIEKLKNAKSEIELDNITTSARKG
jgi:dimeric dUTPase (all-alpha-NTP-PPase superfamily)